MKGLQNLEILKTTFRIYEEEYVLHKDNAEELRKYKIKFWFSIFPDTLVLILFGWVARKMMMKFFRNTELVYLAKHEIPPMMDVDDGDVFIGIRGGTGCFLYFWKMEQRGKFLGITAIHPSLKERWEEQVKTSKAVNLTTVKRD